MVAARYPAEGTAHLRRVAAVAAVAAVVAAVVEPTAAVEGPEEAVQPVS